MPVARLVPVVVAAVVILTGAMATAGTQGTGGLVNLVHLSQVFEVEGQTLRGVWIYAEPGLLASDPYLLRGASGEGVTCVDDVARSAIAFLWAARAGFDDAARYARDQPPTDTAANDVALAGQRLAVPTCAYRQLWVLGASEQGNYSATVTFEYADGSREERGLALSDWCQLPRYGEATALEFGQQRGANGAIKRITCRIYLQKLAVDPSQQLTVISLPDRPTMHIFAITLEEP